MLPDNLIFINACPHDLYFQWQQEVMITNFRKFGISDRIQVIVWYPKGSPELPKWFALQKKYPEVKIFLYEDRGVDLGMYISQLRPHVLSMHFDKHKEMLKDKVFFYHDSDIIFNYLPDFEKLCNDNVCWQSDTSSYLDYNYLRAKEKEGNMPEHEAIQAMADIGRISIELIHFYNGKTGGAQTLLKGIDAEFWRDVERMCLDIRRKFFFGVEDSINRKYFPDEDKGFQSWCADMWALNFSLWNRGLMTNTTDDLDFSWATDNLDTFNKKPIFHNAGVAGTFEDTGLFYKGEWIYRSPLGRDIPLPAEDRASRKYVEAIREVTV